MFKDYIKSLRESIHSPRYKGYPIYGRVNADNRGGDGMFGDSEWLAYTQKHYNSPNNIRRLIISKDRVYIGYYIGVSSKLGGQTMLNKTLRVDNLGEVLSVEQLVKVFKILLEPNTSCLEEIYFSVDVFSAEKPIKEHLDSILRGFTQANRDIFPDINKRYPLLKRIGVVAPYIWKELEAVCKSYREECVKRGKKISDIGVLFDETPIFKSYSQRGFLYCKDIDKSSNKLILDKLKLRVGDYLLDSELLKIFKAYDDSLLAIKSKEINDKYSDSNETINKSNLETSLEVLERKNVKLLKLVFEGIEENDIEDILDTFSSKGKEHFLKLILG